MGKKIYGVDISKKVTPIMVRDAIIKCFLEAHENVLEMMKEYQKFKTKKEFESMKETYVRMLIKSKFNEAGGNFDKPSKEDLIKVVELLADFASRVRNQETIKNHREQIMQLIGKL
ncbi:MAG: hypothetical protein QXK37_06300 [Candidatus Woesearchaeota archaeon]